MIDIDKAIAEHTEKFDAMMERHRHLIAKIDKEAAELRKKTGRSRKKTAAAADAADAEPAAEPDARDAQQAQDVPEDPPTVTL